MYETQHQNQPKISITENNTALTNLKKGTLDKNAFTEHSEKYLILLQINV